MGYYVVFVDVNEDILNLINKDKKYIIYIRDVECIDEVIDNISVVLFIKEEIIDEIV